ncbi:hypothetical protein [Streptomyces carpinensis]|uniref:Uncharacterized protein n=1 Tax=Streptomyces carpinensis TaxID=66369 RepID=A0ABV1WMB4_9ACTN|nr:hypothetical protein [Streptomyces carpinensis]
MTAAMATAVPERRPLAVHIGADSRRFAVSGWSQGIELVSGSTSDLADIVRAGVAWGQGHSPCTMQTELAPAPRDGSPGLVEEGCKKISGGDVENSGLAPSPG